MGKKPKSNLIKIVFLMFFSVGLISLSCASGTFIQPTFTSKPTTKPAPPNTSTNASECLAANGEWVSKETNEGIGIPAPIITFSVADCGITSWEIWTYPAPGELLWWDGALLIPILNNQFVHNEISEEGTFTIEGSFDSAASSHGTINFPKGYFIFDYTLTKDVSIPWTASPSR